MDFYEFLYDDYICLKDDAHYFRFLKISIMSPWQPVLVFYGSLLKKYWMDSHEILYGALVCLKGDALILDI